MISERQVPEDTSRGSRIGADFLASGSVTAQKNPPRQWPISYGMITATLFSRTPPSVQQWMTHRNKDSRGEDVEDGWKKSLLQALLSTRLRQKGFSLFSRWERYLAVPCPMWCCRNPRAGILGHVPNPDILSASITTSDLFVSEVSHLLLWLGYLFLKNNQELNRVTAPRP